MARITVTEGMKKDMKILYERDCISVGEISKKFGVGSIAVRKAIGLENRKLASTNYKVGKLVENNINTAEENRLSIDSRIRELRVGSKLRIEYKTPRSSRLNMDGVLVAKYPSHLSIRGTVNGRIESISLSELYSNLISITPVELQVNELTKTGKNIIES